MGDWDVLTSLNIHVMGLHITNVSIETSCDGLPKVRIEGVVIQSVRNPSTASFGMTDLAEIAQAERARREREAVEDCRLQARLRREDEARRLDKASDEALKDLEGSPEGDWRLNEWRADGDLFL